MGTGSQGHVLEVTLLGCRTALLGYNDGLTYSWSLTVTVIVTFQDEDELKIV